MVEPETMRDIEDEARTVLRLKPEWLHVDERIHRQVSATCQGQGIAVADLLEPLRQFKAERPSPGPLYWRADFHLSTWGHAAVAVALRSQVVE
jgi:hypothetical protein